MNTSPLFGKNILLGITGSIAAYKTPELTRQLVKLGANVKIIVTKDACNFVTPLTLSTVSKNPVLSSLISDNNTWNNHVDLAGWADIFLIAPATANVIAKMACGICDSILLATFLSSSCKVFCAPAMDRDMYLNSVTKENINTLIERGVNIIESESGELASGLFGYGRMCSLKKIISSIEFFFKTSLPFINKNILITAGPTYEKIDPVRFIGNFSTGKMGCEIANVAANLGANVTLVIGPSNIKLRSPNIKRIDVQSASEMYESSLIEFDKSDIVIFSAAVSDYKPVKYSESKIKNRIEKIPLEENIDILKTLASRKKKQFLVGFALETDNEVDNAYDKIINKKIDLIVLNSLNDKGAGFGTKTNKIKIIDKKKNIKDFPLLPKKEVAQKILDEIYIKTLNLNLKKIIR